MLILVLSTGVDMVLSTGVNIGAIHWCGYWYCPLVLVILVLSTGDDIGAVRWC